MEKHVKDRIFRNAVLSIFIYALPVLLMFTTFKITGDKPWLKKPEKHTVAYKSNIFSNLFKTQNRD